MKIDLSEWAFFSSHSIEFFVCCSNCWIHVMLFCSGYCIYLTVPIRKYFIFETQISDYHFRSKSCEMFKSQLMQISTYFAEEGSIEERGIFYKSLNPYFKMFIESLYWLSISNISFYKIGEPLCKAEFFIITTYSYWPSSSVSNVSIFSFLLKYFLLYYFSI